MPNPFESPQRDPLLEALGPTASNPFAGLSVWRGLLPALLGQPVMSPAEGPEDFALFNVGGIGRLAPVFRSQPRGTQTSVQKWDRSKQTWVEKAVLENEAEAQAWINAQNYLPNR